ncbi:winged helix-turn-helix domain-containing protein [Yokenella regensburgei]|uniref:winged helix-turn-helix domain-containing protein n=1 Tax=Yokenella regensburgei TaxID=158877 RepID=UPI003ED8B26C
MLFICNNSLLFDPGAQQISLVGQAESTLTLSAPGVRLLLEFIRHKGSDLSREELITRVWQDFGYTPSGNNLNKAVSELRKAFQSLGESEPLIVTVPRFGFRFEAEVVCQIAEKHHCCEAPEKTLKEPEVVSRATTKARFSTRWYYSLIVLLAVAGLGAYLCLPRDISVPLELKAFEEGIAGCKIWLINDHGRPLVLSRLAPLLEENKVNCQREHYNLYYFSARFSISSADEVFIGACPVNKSSLCKTIRYKSGAEE